MKNFFYEKLLLSLDTRRETEILASLGFPSIYILDFLKFGPWGHILLLKVVVPLLPLPSRTHRKVRRCQTWFYPLWPYFGLFLAVSCPKIVRIFAGQHILLTVCRHQVDTPEKLSQAMIIYSKMQFLFILTQFWPVLGHFWPRYFEKYYWTACFAQMLSGSA